MRRSLYISLIILAILLLIGCSDTQNQIIIQTNQFTQTNYDYNCLTEDKTFSEIILCYQAQDSAEKEQNNITNDLIYRGSQKQ